MREEVRTGDGLEGDSPSTELVRVAFVISAGMVRERCVDTQFSF